MTPQNIEALVARYKDSNAPTLIIWGRQDKIISPEAGTLLAQAIPDSSLHWIDQCGHVPQEERPEATIPLVLDFLKSRRVVAPGERNRRNEIPDNRVKE